MRVGRVGQDRVAEVAAGAHGLADRERLGLAQQSARQRDTLPQPAKHQADRLLVASERVKTSPESPFPRPVLVALFPRIVVVWQLEQRAHRLHHVARRQGQGRGLLLRKEKTHKTEDDVGSKEDENE